MPSCDACAACECKSNACACDCKSSACACNCSSGFTNSEKEEMMDAIRDLTAEVRNGQKRNAALLKKLIELGIDPDDIDME